MGQNGKNPKRIVVDGIPIEIYRKRIKNVYLSVKAPDGIVTVSAPARVGDADIEKWIVSKLPWLRSKLENAPKRHALPERQYVSGETVFVWGVPLVLEIREGTIPDFRLTESTLLLTVKPGSTSADRALQLREVYRKLLQERMEQMLPVWEAKTGLRSREWRTKQMKTRWGSCNTREKRLWFNVALAEKPPECLAYVILHELAHTEVPNHGAAFTAILDRYMPDWRSVRDRLNGKY